MSIKAYLNFKGNCREAIEFYSGVFHTEAPRILSFGDMPQNEEFPLPENMIKQVAHAEIKIGESTVMFSDVPEDNPFIIGNNIILLYSSKDTEEIKDIYDKLKDGGKVIMELQETFWSKCYGYVIDKFGIGWQLNYEK